MKTSLVVILINELKSALFTTFQKVILLCQFIPSFSCKIYVKLILSLFVAEKKVTSEINLFCMATLIQR